MSSPIAKKLSQQQAEAVARVLDVGLEAPICLACLSFVSMAGDTGDPKDVAAQAYKALMRGQAGAVRCRGSRGAR